MMPPAFCGAPLSVFLILDIQPRSATAVPRRSRFKNASLLKRRRTIERDQYAAQLHDRQARQLTTTALRIKTRTAKGRPCDGARNGWRESGVSLRCLRLLRRMCFVSVCAWPGTEHA